jgi:hypothetical protein
MPQPRKGVHFALRQIAKFLFAARKMAAGAKAGGELVAPLPTHSRVRIPGVLIRDLHPFSRAHNSRTQVTRVAKSVLNNRPRRGEFFCG